MLGLELNEDVRNLVSIPEEALYYGDSEWDQGYTNWPHVTLKYGLLPGVDQQMIDQALEDWFIMEVFTERLEIFETEEYNVLVLRLEDTQMSYMPGKTLRDAYDRLSKLPHVDTFPDYKPHMTIAYLKKGLDQQTLSSIVGQASQASETRITPGKIVYSGS